MHGSQASVVIYEAIRQWQSLPAKGNMKDSQTQHAPHHRAAEEGDCPEVTTADVGEKVNAEDVAGAVTVLMDAGGDTDAPKVSMIRGDDPP